MLKRSFLLAIVILISILACALITASTAAIITSPFHYSFSTPGVLYESGSQQESTSPYWWLNSGAKLNISQGLGRTIQKELKALDKWRLLYLNSNPIDTDKGYHPQNIFRLLTRSKWKNSTEEAYFRIIRYEISQSPNRDEYNGLLLINRYLSSNTLYYAGIRVDGSSVIKKKLNGRYYTLAQKKIFPGTYDKILNPGLIPKNIWIGLRSEIKNIGSKVSIKLYMDKNKTGIWTLIAETIDATSPILTEGYGGIRTDFLDVEFEDFRLKNV